MSVRRTKLGANGQIVIPAPFCQALDIRPGDGLIIRLEDDAIRVTSSKLAIERARRMFDRYVGSDVSLADSLIADRRAEAARE